MGQPSEFESRVLRLSRSERERRRQQNLCIYCAGNDHWINHCPEKHFVLPLSTSQVRWRLLHGLCMYCGDSTHNKFECKYRTEFLSGVYDDQENYTKLESVGTNKTSVTLREPTNGHQPVSEAKYIATSRGHAQEDLAPSNTPSDRKDYGVPYMQVVRPNTSSYPNLA